MIYDYQNKYSANMLYMIKNNTNTIQQILIKYDKKQLLFHQ
ncbi:hypothetical protein CHCC14819_0700 [Bacillus licheniformis]|nr:hypothetical protein B4091_2986 [Bacillus licheniformis]TWJ89824.1 hypothetical protein CHCC20496_2750 [Bacillus licheniformis]TWK35136.1 hypothetical protein CHCC20369_4324 [Bacillus licheniformis]TWK56527.1 hypothetical protein CHCC20344_2819 [Bacillus licheniformis]TWK67071.1 hypothetical protein CHCC20341_2503 [Bacillus licheniformis]